MLQERQPDAVQFVVVLRYQQTVTKARGHCQPLRAIETQDQAHGLMRPLFCVLFALHVRRVEVLLNAGDTERAPGNAVFEYLLLRVGPPRVNQRGIQPCHTPYPTAN